MVSKTDSRKVDEAFKKFFEDPNVCADIANAVLLDGKNIIQPGNISLVNTEQVDDALQIRRRDIIFEAHIKDGRILRVCLIGVEEQISNDNTMPIRAMGYDYGRYLSQIDAYEKPNIKGKRKRKWKRSTRIKRTETVVVNLSGKKWRSPIYVHDMDESAYKIDVNPMPDYYYVLIDPYDKDQDWQQLLKGEMKLLLRILMHSKNEKEMNRLMENPEEYDKLSLNCGRLIKEVTGINMIEMDGEEMSVCRAWTDHYKSGVKEGIKEGKLIGKAEGIKAGKAEGMKEGQTKGELNRKITEIHKLQKVNFTIEQIADFVDEDVAFVKKYLAA